MMKRGKRILLAFVSLALLAGTTAAEEKTPSSDVEKAIQKKEDLNQKSSGRAISVSPGTIDFEGAPGEKASFVLTAYNNSSVPSAVEVSKSAAVVGKTGGITTLPLSKAMDPNTLGRLIEVTPNNVTLPPRGEQKVTVSLKVPPDYVGTHYASISVIEGNIEGPRPAEEKDAEHTRTASIGVRAGISVPVTFTVKGAATYLLDVTDAKVTPPSASALMTGRAVVRNSGNAELGAVLSGVVLDGSGTMVARLKASALKTIRPGTEVDLETEPSSKALPKGQYKALLTLTSPKIQPITKEVLLTVK